MYQPQTFGGKIFRRFQQKGWSIHYTDEIQDRVSVRPPIRLNSPHLFSIYIPVVRHTWQPDLSREWYAALQIDRTMHGPSFEAKAIPDDTERFAAFAAWISDLVKNPKKFL